MRMSSSASTQDLAVHLTALPDREVAALLVARPDLAAPPSSSFLALATRIRGAVNCSLASRFRCWGAEDGVKVSLRLE